MRPTPTVTSVVLFGWGQWSRKSWFPILKVLAEWGVIHLTVVDRWKVPPTELAALIETGALDYKSWDCCFAPAPAPPWQIAFVVTSANAQADVVRHLLQRAPELKVIICEKPCGENLEQAQAMATACLNAKVVLLMADHYLLRPPVQHLLTHPALLRSVGELMYIEARLNESQPTGPGQGVVADLLVHLLDILFALFPLANFAPDVAHVARASVSTHTPEETYSYCLGKLIMPDQHPVVCQLECGKQLSKDQKDICFAGKNGKLH